MKAIYHEKYCQPEELQFKEIETPEPEANEVRVKIDCSAVNDWDWSMVRGKPGAYRLFLGLFKPKNHIPGMELSGVIDAVGKNVSKFQPGDAVYGDTSEFKFGTYADYLCVDEKALVKKPEQMSFEDAAALSHASMLAWQGFVDIGKIRSDEKILINGAGGGVGTLGLQMAKTYNAEVTGVDTGDKLEKMKEIGFDHIIDYKKEDFTRNGLKYDLILDTKTTRPPRAFKRSLSPQGRYVTVGGDLLRIIQISLSGLLGKKNMHMLALKTNKDLEIINQLYLDGKIKPTIDGPYPLEKASEMLRYFGEGKHTGKVILKPSM